MSKKDKLIISDLIFHGYCGITEEERKVGGKFSVYMEIACDITKAAETDSIKDTVNYAEITETVLKLGREKKYSLLETMAEEIASAIIQNYHVQKIHLNVKKLMPPIEEIKGYFAVEITREC